jgi:NADH-quinone oxidoreductase subunit E
VGETTQYREFSIDRVAYVACCVLAPAALIHGTVYGHLALSKVEGLILSFEIEKEQEKREKKKSESK